MAEKAILNLRADHGFLEDEPERASLLDVLSVLVWQAYLWLLFAGLLLLAAAFGARLPRRPRVLTLLVAASVLPVPIVSSALFVMLGLDANDLAYAYGDEFYLSDFVAGFAGPVLLYLGSALLGWVLLRLDS